VRQVVKANLIQYKCQQVWFEGFYSFYRVSRFCFFTFTDVILNFLDTCG